MTAGDEVSVDKVSVRRRAAAWGIDFALVLVFATLLGVVTHYRISDYLSGWVELRGVGAWEVIRSNGDWSGADMTFGTDVVDTVLLMVIQAFALLVVVTFAYQFIGNIWKGQTFGKLILDVRVLSAGDRGRVGRWQAGRRALGRTITDVGVYAAACIALLAGRFVLSFVLWAVAIVLLVLDGVFLFGASRRSVVDRFAGTVVVPAGLYRRSWEFAQENELLTRGIVTARSGVGRVQEMTQRVADPEQMRRLSHFGQDVGRLSAGAARRVAASERGRQAQQTAKSAGANLNRVYDRRRDGRNTPA